MNIRLDFITDIQPGYIEKMTRIRKEYMSLDEALKVASEYTEDKAALRTIALARTNLEISLQYAIKSLCLLGEVK